MRECRESFFYRPVHNIERVEYLCQCGEGYYRYEPNGQRTTTHNQMPHRCTQCGQRVYFTIPYPALRYKGRIFVDWETVRGYPLENKETD